MKPSLFVNLRIKKSPVNLTTSLTNNTFTIKTLAVTHVQYSPSQITEYERYERLQTMKFDNFSITETVGTI